jgi:nitrite reductase/ring-hydroxylating ferredoxin subunit
MTTETGAARPSRRIVFQGLSALGVAAVLAGCGGDEESAPRASTPSSGESSAGPSGSGKAASSKPKPKSKQPTVDALATTDEIPVGGGIVLTDARIVITQPSQGEFQAFSAVCTHQGQTVGEVQDNTITCKFHGSQYDAATGDVTNGPATAGLDPVKVRVEGGQIVRA